MNTKTAVAQETVEFAEWVLLTQKPLKEEQIRNFLDRLGMPIQPPITKRQGPRFQKGDMVQIKKDKHTDAATSAPYVEFNGKVGTVTEIDGEDALVEFKGQGAPVRFVGAQKARGVGIYKYTPAFVVTGSPAVEIIYQAGGQANDEQKIVVEKYLSRGKPGEQRMGYYYTGHLFNARTNAKGEVYFQVFPQQRVEIDPSSEAGFMARSFNPSLGKVLYIGALRSRPTHWKDDLETLKHMAEEEAAENDPLGIHLAGDPGLRKHLIHLAHQNPELRPHLLPVLTRAQKGVTGRMAAGDRIMATKDLPDTLKDALKAVGFRKPQVRVETGTTYNVQNMGGDGYQAFAMAVDLDSGQTKLIQGSWGGPNPYEVKQVDRDNQNHPLPVGGAVVLGSRGGGHPVSASIRVHPDNLQKLLPGGDEETFSDDELVALEILASSTSAYRKESFPRAGLGAYGPQNVILKSLAAKGLINLTGAGVKLTVKGANVRESNRGRARDLSISRY